MGAAAHVFVDDLTRAELCDEDRHHLARVLRLRPGEVVTAADGRGGWRRFRFAPPGRLEPDGDVEQRPAPWPPVVVGCALTKGERPEWTVQKLTEAGVDRIVLFVAERSVVRWEDDRGPRQLTRVRAVARAAAMQSRRDRVPVVEGVVAFAEAVGRAGPGVALAHPGGTPPGLDHPGVLVGPEGGWSPAELGCGLPKVALGPLVLRAETAAMAIGILLCGLRAGVVGPAG
jgi:16S rRNA (uracil1498-N3)-methyltransferase